MLTFEYLWHWVKLHDVIWYDPLRGFKCETCNVRKSHLKDGH